MHAIDFIVRCRLRVRQFRAGGRFVSIVAVGTDDYLVATYRDVYAFSRSAKRLRRLRPVVGDGTDQGLE